MALTVQAHGPAVAPALRTLVAKFAKFRTHSTPGMVRTRTICINSKYLLILRHSRLCTSLWHLKQTASRRVNIVVHFHALCPSRLSCHIGVKQSFHSFLTLRFTNSSRICSALATAGKK